MVVDLGQRVGVHLVSLAEVHVDVAVEHAVVAIDAPTAAHSRRRTHGTSVDHACVRAVGLLRRVCEDDEPTELLEQAVVEVGHAAWAAARFRRRT